MKKKKVLFVIDTLRIGGAEKSLVSLLQLIDYNVFDIDLLLFGRNGEFERFLPSSVTIIPPPELYNHLKNSVFNNLIRGRVALAMSRIAYSVALRFHRVFSKKATVRWYNQAFWTYFAKFITPQPGIYDTAIAYSQGIPTFFVVDKVSSANKIGWINVYYNLSVAESRFNERFYGSLKKIVLVSDGALEVFQKVFPQYSNKMLVIHDLCNAELLRCMACEGTTEMDMSLPRILTVSRLDKDFKGLDISLATADVLVQRGIRFNWYFVGDGKDRAFMEDYIKTHKLKQYVHLLGAKANPYPFFKNATLYVQTSRQEGWGISIVEARLFNIPVVTTEYGTVWNQMVQRKNGIVTNYDPSCIADAIQELLGDERLYSEMREYLSQEKKGNTEEFLKIKSLIS